MPECHVCFTEIKKGGTKTTCKWKWLMHSVCKECFGNLVTARCERPDDELTAEELSSKQITLPCPAANCMSNIDSDKYFYVMPNARLGDKCPQRIFRNREKALVESAARRDTISAKGSGCSLNTDGYTVFKKALETIDVKLRGSHLSFKPYEPAVPEE
jgi:hypothetical protein